MDTFFKIFAIYLIFFLVLVAGWIVFVIRINILSGIFFNADKRYSIKGLLNRWNLTILVSVLVFSFPLIWSFVSPKPLPVIGDLIRMSGRYGTGMAGTAVAVGLVPALGYLMFLTLRDMETGVARIWPADDAKRLLQFWWTPSQWIFYGKLAFVINLIKFLVMLMVIIVWIILTVQAYQQTGFFINERPIPINNYLNPVKIDY